MRQLLFESRRSPAITADLKTRGSGATNFGVCRATSGETLSSGEARIGEPTAEHDGDHCGDVPDVAAREDL